MFATKFVPAFGAGIAICLMTLPPVVHAAGPATVLDSVTLNFAWPDNLKAKISYFYRKSRRDGRAPRIMTVYGTYDAIVRPVKDGLRLSAENSNLRLKAEGYPPGPQSKLRRFIARTAGRQPAIVVDRSGQFVRLDNVKQYQEMIEDGLNKAFADSPAALRAKIANAVAPTLTEEQLQAVVISDWNRIVGAWLEAVLDIGDLYQLKFKRPVPVLGNASIALVTDIRFVKRAPCSARDRAAKCVELYMRTMADDKAVAKAIEKRTAALIGGGGPAVFVKTFNTSETIRLLTEPNTLIPHRMHSIKNTTMTVETEGKARTVEQVNELKVAYTY